MNKGPLWLKAVHRLERVIGEPVESAVRSDLYFDAVSKISRVKRKGVRTVEGVSRAGLRVLNLPAGTDIRNMHEQLVRIERRLNQLSENVEDLDGRPAGPAEDAVKARSGPARAKRRTTASTREGTSRPGGGG